jgi:hypothetical protein
VFQRIAHNVPLLRGTDDFLGDQHVTIIGLTSDPKCHVEVGRYLTLIERTTREAAVPSKRPSTRYRERTIQLNVATCPHCGGFLDDHHRCFGAWRRMGRWVAMMCVGGLAGLVLAFGLIEHPLPEVIVIAALLGAVLGSSLGQVTRRLP